MPLKLDVKRKLSTRSDRVKATDLHPTEPWMLISLYNGNVNIWNYDSQQMIKSFEVCDLPVRATKFIARKNWVITGSDDMHIRVYNYNTLERVHQFEAHSDYVRAIAVHPTQSFILTSSDDMFIKLWDWDKKWTCTQVFEGHTHYVMQIAFNPKDNNTFASCSLDRTIKVWNLGSGTANFTLEGHEKGINCLDYYYAGDKPYLISGADDRLVKIWDYQNKTCVQTLEGHAQNISCVAFHPELPIILTGSEDGTIRVWHANTYRLESTLNYGLERVWTISCLKGSNSVAIGYDEGSVIIKLGREEPAMSMDTSGKIVWAKHSELQQANIKAMGDQEIKDGERLSLSVKEMGSCEIYPQTIAHNPNGRFVVVCGDGEYIVYTAMALRNKSFGQAQEFVWANDAAIYAIRDNNNSIVVHKNFKELKSFKPDFGVEGVYGGFLLGVKSISGLAFYDWETSTLVRRIEILPKQIFWNESGELLSIVTDESFYVLKYNSESLQNSRDKPELISEDGIEDTFDVLGEVQESVRTGCWVGDCFIYTNSVNRLNYYVGGEIVTIAHLDRVQYLLGYIPKENRLYLGDKELNAVSYSLLLSVLEYQTAVMRRDFATADKVLPTVPKEQRTRVAHFLEKQGFKSQAMAVTCDPEHKFELALQLGDLKIAYQLAKEAESEQKWKQLAELSTNKGEFGLAQECLHEAQDFGGLLLLASSAGNSSMVGKLGSAAEKAGQNNVAFLSYFVLGRLEDCLELLINAGTLPEAAFFARTYLPSQVSRVVALWKQTLGQKNTKAAQSLADPSEYENLFPGLKDAFKAEQFLKPERHQTVSAGLYLSLPSTSERHPIEEVLEAESSGKFHYDASKPTIIDSSADATATSSHGIAKDQTHHGAKKDSPSDHAAKKSLISDHATKKDLNTDNNDLIPDHGAKKSPIPDYGAKKDLIPDISNKKDLIPDHGTKRDQTSDHKADKREPHGEKKNDDFNEERKGLAGVSSGIDHVVESQGKSKPIKTDVDVQKLKMTDEIKPQPSHVTQATLPSEMSKPKPLTPESAAHSHSPITPLVSPLAPSAVQSMEASSTAQRQLPINLEDLESELELDLDNIKIDDNIDLTGLDTEDMDDWE